jgi:hypothetical protein
VAPRIPFASLDGSNKSQLKGYGKNLIMRIHRALCGNARSSGCDVAKFLGYRTGAVTDDRSGGDYRRRFFQKSGMFTERSCFLRRAVFLPLDDGLRNAVA